MNMIINYIRYHLYENKILIDRRFALHIFYYILQNLKDKDDIEMKTT